MKYIILIVAVLFVLVLLVAIFEGITNDRRGNVTDYYLYGKDADEYLKDQVGEEYYNKYYKK